MHKMRNFFIIFAFFLSFFVFSKAEASVISPMITESENGYMQNEAFHTKPYISGFSATGTEVLIYIDGSFAGLVQTEPVASGTDNFHYQHADYLATGTHAVMVLARDRTSLVLSAPSFSEIAVREASVPVPAPSQDGIIGMLPAPTLISPGVGSMMADLKPLIMGLIPSGNNALIYIDGIYNGKLTDLDHESGTANFAYKPFLNLSYGNHSVWAVTEDKNGNKSGKSDIINFRVEPPMPAPTLFEPVVNSETVAAKPYIVGVAKNDSLVKIYIDNKLSGEVKVGQHKTGAVSFAHKPKADLTSGSHTAYTVATDSRGKASVKSNVVKFAVVKPAAVQVKTEVKKDAPAKSAQDKKDSLKTEEKTDEPIAKNDKNKQDEQKTEVKPEENKKKLSLNLIIFIAFLSGVIGWIIWVNKELVKEKLKKD